MAETEDDLSKFAPTGMTCERVGYSICRSVDVFYSLSSSVLLGIDACSELCNCIVHQPFISTLLSIFTLLQIPIPLTSFSNLNSTSLLQQPRQLRFLPLQIRVATDMFLRDIDIGYRSLTTEFLEGVLEVRAVVCESMGSVVKLQHRGWGRERAREGEREDIPT